MSVLWRLKSSFFYELWRLRIAKPLNISNVQGIDTFPCTFL